MRLGSLGIRPAESHTMHSLAPRLSVRSEKADSSEHTALLSSKQSDGESRHSKWEKQTLKSPMLAKKDS